MVGLRSRDEDAAARAFIKTIHPAAGSYNASSTRAINIVLRGLRSCSSPDMAILTFSGEGASFVPHRDMPSVKGKVVLVTGGTSGLGKQSVLEFARHGAAEVWLAARSLEKAQNAVRDIQKTAPNASIKCLELDLSSFDSVKQAAKTFRAQSCRLDILMLNAGIMAVPEGLTKEGYEIQFGTNHLGHALLAKFLMPILLETKEHHPEADVRVVVLTSVGMERHPAGGIDFEAVKTTCPNMQTFTRYGQSKLANALFARELARRYPQIRTAAVHPGVVYTNLGSPLRDAYPWLTLIEPAVKLLLHDAESGSRNQLWASVSDDVVSGQYYVPVGVCGKGRAPVKDDDLARRLWDWTEEQFEAHQG